LLNKKNQINIESAHSKPILTSVFSVHWISTCSSNEYWMSTSGMYFIIFNYF